MTSNKTVESIVTVDETSPLVGILSAPVQQRLAASHTAVVLLNAGLLHRVGPSRLYVDLARSIAKEGISVLRVDLSGIGDSPQRVDVAHELERAVIDVTETLNYLEKQHGPREFILGGICWGADVAWEVGRRDQRVKGLLLLDGFAVKNFRYRLVHLTRKLREGSLIKRAYKFFSRKPSEHTFVRGSSFSRDMPSLVDFRDQAKAMFDRQVQMLFVFTGGVENYYNHRGQVQANLKGLAGSERTVDEIFFAHTDHIYSYKNDRKELISCVLRWLAKRFGGVRP